MNDSDNIPYEKIGDEVRSIEDEIPFDIPDSWEWCRVGDLFANMSGLSYKKDALNIKSEHMIRVLRGGNIGSEQYSLKEDDVFISSEFVKSELLLRKNYMITPSVSSLEHIGKIALIEQDYPDVVVGGFVLMLIPIFNDDALSKFFLYAFATKYHRDKCRSITHKSGQADFIKQGEGGAQPNISKEKIISTLMPIPPIAEQQRIVAKIEEILPMLNGL